jgi:hypothetical protein
MDLHSIVTAGLALVDTPVDYTGTSLSITTVLGGLGIGLSGVVAAALGIQGIRWGVPKIVAFFKRLA